MIGKKVNLFALTILNVVIVSSVTSSTAAPAASSPNIGFQIPSDRMASGEMAITLPVFEQDIQQQETFKAEDE